MKIMSFDLEILTFFKVQFLNFTEGLNFGKHGSLKKVIFITFEGGGVIGCILFFWGSR